MKTLDEVITCLECCGHIDCDDCPYHYEDEKIEVDDCAQAYKDALYHLKEYQKKQKTLEIRAAEYKRGFEQLGVEWSRIKENPPLTWGELKTMEGKPVWVETKYYSSRWAVITDIDDVKIRFVGKKLFDSEIVQEMGDTWQAYRKEHHE